MTRPPRSSLDAHPAYPWMRGAAAVVILCPRPGCYGSAHCPEVREHVFVPRTAQGDQHQNIMGMRSSPKKEEVLVEI
jgi:hypothetical protein